MGALMRYAFPYDMLLVRIHVFILCDSNDAKKDTTVQHVVDREGNNLATCNISHHRRCRRSRRSRGSRISKQCNEEIRSQSDIPTDDDGPNLVLGHWSRMHCHHFNSHHNDVTREYRVRSRVGIAICFRFRLGLPHDDICEVAIAKGKESLGDESF